METGIHTSEQAIYLRIATDLQRKIKCGQTGPDGFVASEHELVREYQVSRVTVRRATEHLVAQELVVRYPGKGIYLRVPAEKKTSVWVVLDNLAWDSCIQLCQGVKTRAAEYGWDVQIHDGHGSQEYNAGLLRKISLNPSRVDGVILMAWHAPAFFELAFEIKKAGIPVVVADYQAGELCVDSVVSDNYAGGYEVGRFLAQKGHRTIGFIGDAETSTVRRRLEGFRDALADHGIVLPRSRIVSLYPDDRFADWGGVVRRAADELFSGKAVPSAVFCSCDAVARSVYKYCESRKLKIPDDVSVVGFDNDPLAEWLSPGLTTVAQAFNAMGCETVDMLKRRMAAPESGVRSVVLPIRLIERKSVK